MKSGILALLFSVCFLAGCNSAPPAPAGPPVANAVRAYNGTASVGDFLTISIDANDKTITYKNYTNGQNGIVSYTVNADGSYTIEDPKGNLLAAYEVPGFMLAVEAANAGPDQDTPALITAVESASASITDFAGRSSNYLQLRTADGGMEFGTVTIGAQGDIQHDGYWPFGLLTQPQSFFNGGTFPASSVVEDASGDFFTINESNGAQDTVFGTQDGLWAVDTQNGAILGLPKAGTKDFSPFSSGTYNAIYYEKPNAQMGQHNFESGTPQEGKAVIVVSASGLATIRDSQNNTMASGTLAAIADTPYIYNGSPSKLPDPCYGMFTIRTVTANSQQDVFASFQGNAVIFSSFETGLPVQPNPTYTYFYGVGLK